jgi:hypothetical protein
VCVCVQCSSITFWQVNVILSMIFHYLPKSTIFASMFVYGKVCYLPKSTIFASMFVYGDSCLFICGFVCLYVCLCHDTGRNFYQINTKLHRNIDRIPGQKCIVFGDLTSLVKVTVTSNIPFTKSPVTQ